MGINAPVVVLCLCCIHFNSKRNVSAAALVVYHFSICCFTGCTGRGIDRSLLTCRKLHSVYCVSLLSATAHVLMTSTRHHHFRHDRKQMLMCLTNMKTCLMWSLVYNLYFYHSVILFLSHQMFWHSFEAVTLSWKICDFFVICDFLTVSHKTRTYYWALMWSHDDHSINAIADDSESCFILQCTLAAFSHWVFACWRFFCPRGDISSKKWSICDLWYMWHWQEVGEVYCCAVVSECGIDVKTYLPGGAKAFAVYHHRLLHQKAASHNKIYSKRLKLIK